MSKHATDFEKIINAGRERKKNEALAAKIFSKDNQRRASAPGKSGLGGSLASRVGVKKRVSSGGVTGGGRMPAGNVNGDWTHDLHSTPPHKPKAQRPHPNSLAARIHAPGTTLPKPRPSPTNARPNRAAKLAHAFNRTTSSPAVAQQANIHTPAPSPAQGISIRGLAGPFVVMAQNFAAGTTAADIESAMTPVGGLVSSCRLVKTHPLVIAEIVFESKEGADQVIQTFNNQTADGRTLHVYLKPGVAYNPMPPTGPRAQRTNESRVGNNVLVDGSMGFDDPTETPSRDDGYSNGALYSDTIVPRHQANGINGSNSRRGRGYRSGR